jgi:hypothetical protein
MLSVGAASRRRIRAKPLSSLHTSAMRLRQEIIARPRPGCYSSTIARHHPPDDCCYMAWLATMASSHHFQTINISIRWTRKKACIFSGKL